MSSDEYEGEEPKKRRRMVCGDAVPYEQVLVPFGHFEARTMERILARRTEADSTMSVLVKWRNLSYLHTEWVPLGLLETVPGASVRIKRFLQKEDVGFDASYCKINRIIDEGEIADPSGSGMLVYYLVKWENLCYDQATWERKEDCERINPSAVQEFLERRIYLPSVKPAKVEWKKHIESPVYRNSNVLRGYQLEGLNWLVYCWMRQQSCIMADEMGLGKTVQSVAFLCELTRTFQFSGPFLVVAPLSTVPHWEREFKRWTWLNCIVFHGNQTARSLIVDTEYYWKDQNGQPITSEYKFDVLITTYEMVMAGCMQLKPIRWRVGILDEAHKLKNNSSKISELLKSFAIEHRVLLTGTPLQNSLNELWALLNFLEPNKFPSEETFMQEYGSLKSSSDVEKLQLLLKPLMLRRMKEDVEKSIPVKEETVIEVELTNTQKKWYRAILERNFSMLRGTKSRETMPSLINVVMELRKCCIHPYLLSGAEDFVIEECDARTPEKQYECLVQASGKLVLLDKLLRKLRSGGHKVLVFSQMTRCLDILADYLKGQQYDFVRIDGNIRGSDRQSAIDRFCAEESDVFVFLLCTRAGGVGINLTAADTAIIFDSDWNPQNDLQAQARCHRIGQKKPVQIYRLITRNTYEKEMFDRAGMKLGLDRAVLQKMESWDTEDSGKMTSAEIEDLLKRGAYGACLDDSESNAFCEEDIELILNKRTTVIRHEQSSASIFSKASFSSSTNNDIDVNDPNFWDKVAEKANFTLPTNAEPKRRAIRYDDYDEEFSRGIVPWSTTEKLYLERRLMVFGLFSWEKLQLSFPRRSIADLQACTRDLVRLLISKLDPIEDAQLIADCEAAVVQRCDPYCQPYGESVPYPNATPKQSAEYMSFLVQAPKEYRETVEKKAKFMLARIQLLMHLHSIVPADLEQARREIVVPPLTRPPAAWWGPDEDRDLLIGTAKHGYHICRPMRHDKDLVFSKRRYDPATFQERKKQDEESDDCVEESECANGELFPWPSKSELGNRLRRIIASLLRERASYDSLSETLRRNVSSPAEDMAWSKRERTDFFRTVSFFGVVAAERLDWGAVRVLAGLEHKSDDTMDAYYNHIIALCLFLVSADHARNTKSTICQRPVDLYEGDDEFTPDKAKKFLKRIEFMDYLRTQVLTSPYLEEILGQAKRTPGLPDWWQSGTHDTPLLNAISKHGYGRCEQIIADNEYVFYFMAENHRSRQESQYFSQSKGLLNVVSGLPWPKESVLNKRIEALCCMVAPRYRTDSTYTPPCYVPPELEDVQIDEEFEIVVDENKKRKKKRKPSEPKAGATITVEAWDDNGERKTDSLVYSGNPFRNGVIDYPLLADFMQSKGMPLKIRIKPIKDLL